MNMLNINLGDCPVRLDENGNPIKPTIFIDMKAWARMAIDNSISGIGPTPSPKDLYDGWMVNNFKDDFLITFTKKDGTERTLHVTHEIPDDKKPKGIKPTVENQDILRVFVKDLQEWRSIRYDSILTLRSV